MYQKNLGEKIVNEKEIKLQYC